MIKRAARFLQRQLLRSSCYRWHVFTPQVSRETIGPLLPLYPFYAAGGRMMQRSADGSVAPLTSAQTRSFRAIKRKRIVYICDGTTLAGGLADRFKGIISLYALCRRMGHDFRICYTSPFRLHDFLAPAACDWVIAPDELRRSEAAIVVLENTDDSDYQTRKQAKWLATMMAEGPEEMHFITNSNLAYQLDYAQLFDELFRPTPRLQQALLTESRALGRYVSVSARFLSMLGDFRETGANSSLPHDEAERLIEANIAQIERIHKRHPECTVLVNSDSSRFLRRAETLPYVYVVSGDVAHTDLMAQSTSDNGDHAPHDAATDRMHLKLFLDFFLISRAEHIYLLQTGLMRISGFPYAASRITDAPFDVVHF